MFTRSLSSLGGLAVLALAACTMTVGCATDMDEGYEDDDADYGGTDDEESGTINSAVAVSGAWRASSAALTGGRRATHGYDGASGKCAGGMLAGTRKLKRHVEQRFGNLIASPGRLDNGTVLPAVQGYNCRTVRGSGGPSMHGMGRALDIFVPTIGRAEAADNTKGDQIANYMVQNAAELGVQYVVWDNAKWSVENKVMEAYTGTHKHQDHVHVEITRKAARQELAWYR